MTEFQELVKDAPKFVSMERGELVAYAYAMYASGVKINAENAKLRELVAKMAREYECGYLTLPQRLADRMRELGVEVDG